MAHNSSIIFITGGVRSGKSEFAEKVARDLWENSNTGELHYIAPMEPSDDENKQRILRHQADRIRSGIQWHTWEQPISIGELAQHFKCNDVVLLDCLTTWLNNEFFFEEDKWQEEAFLKSLFYRIWNGIYEISQKVGAFVIVSNEVLHEPIGQNELVFQYSHLLGGLHQQIVANAKQAFLVEASIPIKMKGGI
jgi:adenosylcobinamide kinase / adenosylcobinamide-phosphate guanylyltransferase